VVVAGAPECPCVIVEGPGIGLRWRGVGHADRVGKGGIVRDK